MSHPDAAVDILFVLDVVVVCAAAAVAWYLQLAGYPLHRRVGRRDFPRYARAQQSASVLVLAPLVLGDFLTSLALLVFPHDPVTNVFVWTGAACAITTTVVTCTVLRQANRRLAEGFEGRAFRRLLAGNCVRANLWSLHAALLAVILVRL